MFIVAFFLIFHKQEANGKENKTLLAQKRTSFMSVILSTGLQYRKYYKDLQKDAPQIIE